MTENIDQNTGNVIKLRIDGSKSTINTLEDSKSQRGVSLLCPFPALEVSIPVTLTGKNGESTIANIHRIGVEDDPVTGLPKLRLSIKNKQGKNISSFESDLKSEEIKESCKEREKDSTDNELSDPSEVDIPVYTDTLADKELQTLSKQDSHDTEPDSLDDSFLEGLLQEVPDSSTHELLSLEEVGLLKGNKSSKDPEWTKLEGVFPASHPSDISKTRRRRIVAQVAAWTLVCGLAGGGLFVLEKAGVTDFSSGKIGSWFSSSKDTSQIQVADSLDDFKQYEAQNEEIVESMYKEGKESNSIELTSSDVEKVAYANEPIEEEVDEYIEDLSAPEVDKDKIQDNQTLETEVMLPTRWPAEYATAYRLQDPNGVVVDVPGGLVQREGWITISEDDNIIRSIKALQRENGARFIVYVKGGLPNFRTNSNRQGVSLSLYYENQEADMSTQTVAGL